MKRYSMLGLLLGLTVVAARAETISVRSDNCMTAADVAYENDDDAEAPVDLNPWRADFDFRHAFIEVPTGRRGARRGPKLYVPVDLEGDPYGVSAEPCEE